MNKKSISSLKWELTRERFRIQDPEPPEERRGPEKQIRDILSGILGKEEEDAGTALPASLEERWPLIAGEQLAKHVHPAYLKKGILYLYADHSGWLAELKRIPKGPLLKKLSALPDIPPIKDLRFQLDPSVQTFRNRKPS